VEFVMSGRQWWIIGYVLLAAGCSGAGSDSVAPTSTPSLLASKVAVLAVAVATGGEGHAFFDNFIPCPRRGVIDYTNIPAGRRATFSGCDAGDGVIVDGSAEVRWVSGDDRTRITRIEVVGALRVGGSGASETLIDALTVTDIAFSSPAEPSVLNLVVAAVRVTALGATAPIDPLASPANVFTPSGRSIDAIPNPAGSLDALTEADLKAIAYGTAMRLASLLFDETLESQRGAHEHELPCGTVRVVPEALHAARAARERVDVVRGRERALRRGELQSALGHVRRSGRTPNDDPRRGTPLRRQRPARGAVALRVVGDGAVHARDGADQRASGGRRA
jgi:hypothetical protein